MVDKKKSHLEMAFSETMQANAPLSKFKEMSKPKVQINLRAQNLHPVEYGVNQ